MKKIQEIFHQKAVWTVEMSEEVSSLTGIDINQELENVLKREFMKDEMNIILEALVILETNYRLDKIKKLSNN